MRSLQYSTLGRRKENEREREREAEEREDEDHDLIPASRDSMVTEGVA